MSCWQEVTCKPMKPRWKCKCTMGGDTIIRLTFGNTVVRGGRWCSTFVWDEVEKVRGSFLGNMEGFWQTDGYVAYEKVGGPGLVHAGCWTHCRRGFANVAKLNPGDPVATPIVEKINALFAIDAAAREQGLNIEARQALRREKAPAVLGTIKAAVESVRASALPGSTLGKACEYALGQWPKLIRFLDYPELELSTNLAENSIRPIAVGRKNWIHVGSPQAGPKVAAILSIFETCRRIKLPVREYLSAVLPGLANTQLRRLSDLTPTAWVGQHSQSTSQRD